MGQLFTATAAICIKRLAIHQHCGKGNFSLTCVQITPTLSNDTPLPHSLPGAYCAVLYGGGCFSEVRDVSSQVANMHRLGAVAVAGAVVVPRSLPGEAEVPTRALWQGGRSPPPPLITTKPSWKASWKVCCASFFSCSRGSTAPFLHDRAGKIPEQATRTPAKPGRQVSCCSTLLGSFLVWPNPPGCSAW
jgi:hypothetical protein